MLVRYLIDNGADVNRGDDKHSPLAIARLTDDDKDLEQLLLKAGADPNTEAEEGNAATTPKKMNAAAAKLAYYVEAADVAGKEANLEKQKIISGKK
jgi:ankyrin repeat protein